MRGIVDLQDTAIRPENIPFYSDSQILRLLNFHLYKKSDGQEHVTRLTAPYTNESLVYNRLCDDVFRFTKRSEMSGFHSVESYFKSIGLPLFERCYVNVF